MKRMRLLIVATLIGAWGLLLAPAPARAFTCNEPPWLDDGGLVCAVAYTASGPVCHKYGCL